MLAKISGKWVSHTLLTAGGLKMIQQLREQFSNFSNNRSTFIACHSVTVCGHLPKKVKHTLI